MKKQILPVMVSTWEGLHLAAGEGCTVIYVERTLYNQDPGRARRILGEQGYVLSIPPGKRGVFFLRQTGAHRFQQDIHEIYDPKAIL